MVIHFLPHLTNVSALYQAKHGNAKIANVKCCDRPTYSLPVQPADGGALSAVDIHMVMQRRTALAGYATMHDE